MTHFEKIVAHLRLACLTGFYNGLIEAPGQKQYVQRCTGFARVDGTCMIYTRDIGYHSSGWWKNPQFEQCFHLSISFKDPLTLRPAQFNHKRAKAVAKLFFGHDLEKVWMEPPYTPEGKHNGVHHYRLFTDPGWNPIKPTGEVYSKELTEKGWKSFSELHGDNAKNFDPPQGMTP